MANKKRRCKGCKEYFDFDSFEIKRPRNNFHSIQCLLTYTRQKQKEEQIKATAKLYQQKTKTKDPKKRAKERAIYWCHKYIRERDRGEPCICCNRPIEQGQGDAGHYISAGLHAYCRFDERNIHLQHYQCNRFKGGDSGKYRINLIKKIGQCAVEELEENAHKIMNRNTEGYRQIAEHYRKKYKKMITED